MTVEPGDRCPECDRRVPHPRTPKAPESKAVQARLPVEEAAAVDEALDNLAAYTGADRGKYPKGRIIQGAVLMAGQRREELRDWFEEAERARAEWVAREEAVAELRDSCAGDEEQT